MEQYYNIDSLEFGFLKIRRFFNMAEGMENWKSKIFAQKRILSKIYSSRWWNKQ